MHWASGGDSLEVCGLLPTPLLSNDVFNGASRYIVGDVGNPFFQGQSQARAYMKSIGARGLTDRLCAELFRDFGPSGLRLPGLVKAASQGRRARR
jgi:hypothetical protein